MAKPLTASMAPELDLIGDYVIRWDAVDPTTGATVSGVVVSDASVFAADLGGSAGELAVGPFKLVPGTGG